MPPFDRRDGHKEPSVYYLKVAFWLVVAWCVMVLTHELGHVVGGTLSGGVLRDLELRPWRLPYSTFDPDPHPLIRLWFGPFVGTLLPLAVAQFIRREETQFIAWFCVMANGLYVGLSWVVGGNQLDGPLLIQHGSHPVLVAAYALIASVGGHHRWRYYLRRIR